MAYKEPRVPPVREADPSGALRALSLFLRDFCADAWNADRRKDEAIERLKRRMDAMEKRTGAR